MTYKPKFFQLQELVPPHVYNTRGEKAWLLLDDRLLLTLDALRYEFGPIIINTWHSGRMILAYGDREQSGYRTQHFYASAARYFDSMSQHKYGRAADMLFAENKVHVVRNKILKNPEQYPYINGVELDTFWLHIDCGNREHITTFNG